MTKPELTAPSAAPELRLLQVTTHHLYTLSTHPLKTSFNTLSHIPFHPPFSWYLQVLRLIMTLRTSVSSSPTTAAGGGDAAGSASSGNNRGRSRNRSGGDGGGGGRSAGGYSRHAPSDALDEEDLPVLMGDGAGDDLIDASDLPVTTGPNDQVHSRYLPSHTVVYTLITHAITPSSLLVSPSLQTTTTRWYPRTFA